jgi:integral membrane protein
VLDLSTPAKRFRFVAILEALTWVGLLTGMAFKYLPENGNEIGVKIFGPIHGGVFVLFLIVTLLSARALRWTPVVTLVALISSVPPLATAAFEVWAVRAGQLGELSGETAPAEA